MVLRLRRAVFLLTNHSSSRSSSSSTSSSLSFLQRRHSSSTASAASYLGSPQTQALAEGVLNGHRLSLSRAITLIESTRESHRQEAEALLDHVVRERSRRAAAAAAMTNKNNKKPGSTSRRHNSCSSTSTTATSTNEEVSPPTKTDTTSRPLRIGIAGPPGAGKSTFIEALGKHLLDNKGLVGFY